MQKVSLLMVTLVLWAAGGRYVQAAETRGPSFKLKAAAYLDGATKVAQASKADCKAQKVKIEAYLESHRSELISLGKMAKELRERGETLDKARIVVMLRGAHDRFHAAFQEACKLNKISVLVGFHLMLKSRQERARIANKIAKINKKIMNANRAYEQAQKMPRLVVRVPKKPGPIGLFGPIKFGMSLAEARKAQPSLSLTSSSVGGGHDGPTPKLKVDGVGFSFHEKSFVAKGAFPWVWPKNPEYYVGKVLNIQSYVRFEGFEAKDAKDQRKAKADWRVESMRIDFRDFKDAYDVVFADLSKRWGTPSTQVVGYGKKIQQHLWSNPEEGLCVLLREDTWNASKTYSMQIRPCQSVTQVMRMVLTPAGHPNAILGSTLAQLKKRFGEINISHNNSSRSLSIYVAMWSIGQTNDHGMLHVDLDAKGVVVAAHVTFREHEFDTAKLSPIKDVLASELKRQLGVDDQTALKTIRGFKKGALIPRKKLPKTATPLYVQLTKRFSDRALHVSVNVVSFCGRLYMPSVKDVTCNLANVSDISALSSISSLSHLNLAKTQVQDLTPLRHHTAIRRLSLHGTKVRDLSPLTTRRLRFLDIGATKINNINALSKNMELRTLKLNKTAVVSLEPLKNHRNLRNLSASVTKLTDLSPLARSVDLEKLTLYGVKTISDLSPIKKHVKLTNLVLNGTGIRDLKAIKGLTKLKLLSVDKTAVKDLTPVRAMTELRTLFFSRTNVTDVTPIAGLTNLETLAMEFTKVSDITALKALTKLRVMSINHTTVTDVSALSGLTTLKLLLIKGTGVTDISPLKGIKGLKIKR